METGIEQELEDMQAARHEHELGKVSQAYWQKQRCVRCSSDVIPKLKHVSERHQADDCVIPTTQCVSNGRRMQAIGHVGSPDSGLQQD